MIIGIDASRANRENKTGVEWYAWHIIENLKKEIPDDVRVVLYSESSLIGELANLPPNWQSKVLSWKPRFLWTQIRLSFEMLVNRPDILFVPAHVSPIVRPKKTVMTVHDIGAARISESYKKFQCWYSLWSAKFAVERLWRVIVPTEFTKLELIKEFGITKAKNICVIAHGYDKKYLEKADEQELHSICMKYKVFRPYFLMVGRLEDKKNTAVAIDAFEMFKKNRSNAKVNLFLAGSPGYGYDLIKAKIDASPYQEDIVEPGWVDEDDLPLLVKSAMSMLLISKYEGFGIPIIESMACGTPVIASDIESLREVGGDAALYSAMGDAVSLAKVMDMLFIEQALREEIVCLGFGRAKHYSWEKAAKQTLNCLLSE